MKDDKDLYTYLDTKFTSVENKISKISIKLNRLEVHTWLQYVLFGVLGIVMAFFEFRLDDITKRVDSLYYIFKPYESPSLNINNTYTPTNTSNNSTKIHKQETNNSTTNSKTNSLFGK